MKLINVDQCDPEVAMGPATPVPIQCAHMQLSVLKTDKLKVYTMSIQMASTCVHLWIWLLHACSCNWVRRSCFSLLRYFTLFGTFRYCIVQHFSMCLHAPGHTFAQAKGCQKSMVLYAVWFTQQPSYHLHLLTHVRLAHINSTSTCKPWPSAIWYHSLHHSITDNRAGSFESRDASNFLKSAFQSFDSLCRCLMLKLFKTVQTAQYTSHTVHSTSSHGPQGPI